jgi:phage protein U
MFALLGEILFEIDRTIPNSTRQKAWESFRSSTDYHYAEHKVVEARPRLQWIATELEKLTLTMGFHVAFINPKIAMDQLRNAALDHQARALVYGNGVHRGYFVIQTIEETHIQQADDGSYVCLEARVELQEWVPGADFDPLAPPRRAGRPLGIVDADRAFSATPGSIVAQLGTPGPFTLPGGSQPQLQQPGASAVSYKIIIGYTLFGQPVFQGQSPPAGSYWIPLTSYEVAQEQAGVPIGTPL